jgi:hypothetical protein
VPVIVQHTGFGCALPKEAHAAIEELGAAPERHLRAAREIAHEYFDARKLMKRLLKQAL